MSEQQHASKNNSPNTTGKPKLEQDSNAFLEDEQIFRTLAAPSSRQIPLSASNIQRMSALYGNQAVQRLLIQRGVWKEGGKNAVAIPSHAKRQYQWVIGRNLHTAPIVNGYQHSGKVSFAQVPNLAAGTLAYQYTAREQRVGGRTFNNGAQPDSARLPTMETYTEWDVNAYVPGQGRGAERVVISSGGTGYYSGDHYANFTEIKK